MDIQFTVTPTAYNRIEDMRESKGDASQYLRITVSGGGCSGFRYDLTWDSTISETDVVIDDAVVIDDMSVSFLQGASLDYAVTMMGENFKVVNPNATSGCGCGESFSV